MEKVGYYAMAIVLAIVLFTFIGTAAGNLITSGNNLRSTACTGAGGYFVTNTSGDFCQVSALNFTTVSYTPYAGSGLFNSTGGIILTLIFVAALFIVIYAFLRNRK